MNFKNRLKITALAIASFLLIGCKADSLEIEIDSESIASSLSGQPTSVDFEAEFQILGELDDEQKAMLDRVSEFTEDYLDVTDIEITSGLMGGKLIIEGRLPISNQPNYPSAWYIKTSQESPSLTKVELTTGTEFEAFSSTLGGINFMLTPSAFHSAKFKLRVDDAKYVIAPAVEIDGTTHLLFSGPVEKRLTMNFTGEPFAKTGAGFFIDLENSSDPVESSGLALNTSSLISSWHDSNSACRGGSGGSNETWEACGRRQAYQGLLTNLGYCYEGETTAEAEWRPCSS